MCTQQLIWCSCGHGEFLPIERCPRALRLGYCFTVIHGDHTMVINMACSYCKAGLNQQRPIGAPLVLPQPLPVLLPWAEADEVRPGMGEEAETVVSTIAEMSPMPEEDVVEMPWFGEFEDVLASESGKGFDLEAEMME